MNEKIIEDLIDDKFINRENLKLAYKILNNPENCSKIIELEQLKKFFLKRINEIPNNSPQYLFENDKIFMIDILQGDILNGLVNYCKRLFTILDLNKIVKYNYDIFIINFLSEFPLNFLKDFFKKLIHVESLINLDFYLFRNYINWLWELFQKLKIPEKDKPELFVPQLKNLLFKLIELDRISDVLFVEMLCYSCAIHGLQEMYEEFKKIENEICKPCQEYYKNWVKKNNLPQCKKEITKNGKIKLAFVRPVITYWSPFKLEYSYIKKLLEDEEFNTRYEIYFYTMSMYELGDDEKEQQCIDLLKSLNIKVFAPVKNYNEHLHFCDFAKKVIEFRERLIKDKIDIVIYTDHFYSVGELLFISRVAPKQIYWAHMNTAVDFEGIDKRIIHFPPPKGCEYEFEQFQIQLDEIFLQGDKKKWKKEAERIRKRFPEGTIILGSIGRLVKVDNWDYLSTVAKILKNNPDTVYLACGPGETKGIKEKIKKLGIEDRFFFEGWVDPRIYAFVIDVYLNTFPNWSGEVLTEYHKTNPEGFIVSLER